MALRDQPGDNESDLSFCVVKRVIEEHSGATAVRAYEFLSFKELINYYQKNRAAIDLEIAAAQLNQGKSIATELAEKEKTPYQL